MSETSPTGPNDRTLRTPDSPPQPEPAIPTSQTTTSHPGAPGFQSLMPLVESISKVAAGFLLAAYVSGYLIVSIYNSSFGFTELNPLKPKILGAGILFGALTAIAFYASNLIYSKPSTAEGTLRKVDTYLSRTVAYFYACSVGTNGLSLIISQRTEAQPLLKAPAVLAPIFHVPADTPSLLFFLITVPLFVLSVRQLKLTAKHPSISVSAALLLLAIQTADDLFRATVYSSTWIGLWLFGSGLALRPLAIIALNPQRRRTLDWTTQLFVPITALFFFSRWIYPKIKASWGGGEPIPVVLYLTKDSPLKPGESYPVLLLDESDTGFYFAEQPRSKAVFIPRSQVSMIFFSDKPLPTPSTEKPNPVTPQGALPSPTPEKPKPQPR